MDYQDFLASKRLVVPNCGLTIDPASLHSKLFGFQRDLTSWALRKGRGAIFADTGLGKSFMQLEWARAIGERTLIVAPLTVTRQTVKEAAKLDMEIHYTRNGGDVASGINITNYEMLEHFTPDAFKGIVLDESSILKSLDGKTKARLIAMFASTPYRLCCTATPAPNDITEIANHAEFLGIMSRADMLASFFVHDDNGWRLKGHAEEPFYRWLASWGMSIRMPSDLGYSDDGYILPPLDIQPVWVETDYRPDGMLFNVGLRGIEDRAKVRKASFRDRVEAAARIVNADTDQWVVWCGLNDESELLGKLIPGSVTVEGSQKPDEKAAAIEAFQDGQYRVLVTKAKIAGYGLNLQNCHKMAFVGLSDSWEAYYQCIRRCYRFGQTQPVDVRIVLSEPERVIFDNVMRKEAEAREMSQKLTANVKEFEKTELGYKPDDAAYETATVRAKDYTLMLGDSVDRLAEVENDSVDLSVFSPPFLSLFTYSPTERDIGNCRGAEAFYTHFGFIMDHLLRATKPGRNCCVHVAQVPAMLARDNYIGLKDFRGMTIDAFEERGWIYHGEVCIDKDPQAQAIRTHSKGLLFVQLKKDSGWLRPALADYILVFRKPGDNEVPIIPDLTNEEWIEFARPIWYGIKESDTLNVVEARSSDDERHICPLQLGTIERCIRLWSNKGETILSPFMGIGSEGYQAVKLGRKFVGCELKPAYFKVAVKNLAEAERLSQSQDLFSYAEAR